jgi:hypothetical protein
MYSDDTAFEPFDESPLEKAIRLQNGLIAQATGNVFDGGDGDAHGQGRNPIRPTPRHAELAVNLAGTMAAFLVSTWKEIKTAAPI